MNPRRVHELMRKHFPAFDSAKADWTNLSDRSGADRHRLGSFLDQHIDAPEILVEVSRTVGAYLSKADAVEFMPNMSGMDKSW